MFGVLTTEDLDQALARSVPAPGGHNVGAECAEGAIEMARHLRSGTDPRR
jgi:6,7-dimethyl-8-ribityllumazine synthase